MPANSQSRTPVILPEETSTMRLAKCRSLWASRSLTLFSSSASVGTMATTVSRRGITSHIYARFSWTRIRPTCLRICAEFTSTYVECGPFVLRNGTVWPSSHKFRLATYRTSRRPSPRAYLPSCRRELALLHIPMGGPVAGRGSRSPQDLANLSIVQLVIDFTERHTLDPGEQSKIRGRLCRTRKDRTL